MERMTIPDVIFDKNTTRRTIIDASEVRKHAMDFYWRLKKIEDILGDDYDLDRLRELVEADRDGRCVVLPCKEGERIYKITPKYLNKYGCDCCLNRYGMSSICEYYDESSDSCKNLIDPESRYDIISKQFCLEMVCDFGKTVFLTREAAENALKGERDAAEV